MDDTGIVLGVGDDDNEANLRGIVIIVCAKEASVKTTTCNKLRSSGTNRKPLVLFSLCHSKRLFSLIASDSFRLITCAAKLRSKEASG